VEKAAAAAHGSDLEDAAGGEDEPGVALPGFHHAMSSQAFTLEDPSRHADTATEWPSPQQLYGNLDAATTQEQEQEQEQGGNNDDDDDDDDDAQEEEAEEDQEDYDT
jgi:hypothetical protein